MNFFDSLTVVNTVALVAVSFVMLALARQTAQLVVARAPDVHHRSIDFEFLGSEAISSHVGLVIFVSKSCRACHDRLEDLARFDVGDIPLLLVGSSAIDIPTGMSARFVQVDAERLDGAGLTFTPTAVLRVLNVSRELRMGSRADVKRIVSETKEAMGELKVSRSKGRG